jgi:hypothetical protein
MPVEIFKQETRNEFRWCPWDLQNWFNFVVAAGWLSIYEASADASGEELNVLMAQGTKEGGPAFYKDHPDGKILGDRDKVTGVPKAFGLHQLHAFGNQTAEDLLPPELNIPEAARRLAANRAAILKWAPKHGIELTDDLEDHLALDAYNRGVNGEEAAFLADPVHPDAKTAGGAYATDILLRAEVMDQLLAAAQGSVDPGGDAGHTAAGG